MTERVTVDSNILIYADDRAEPGKQAVADALMMRIARRGEAFLTQQALGEFLNAGRRRRIAGLPHRVDRYRTLFPVLPTSLNQLTDAFALAERRQKQFWDMVIVRVAADAGATALFTEDIGDGEIIDGVRIVNPFSAANTALIDALLRDEN